MKNCGALTVLLILFRPCWADITVSRRPKVTNVRSGDIAVQFTHPGGEGALLSGVSFSGLETIGRPGLLWGAELRDTTGARVLLHGGMGSVDVTSAGDVLSLGWTGLPVVGGDTCDVRVDALLESERRRTEWRIAFNSVPSGWSLYRYRFPVVALSVPEADDCSLIEPSDWGTLVRNPLRNLPQGERRYPRSEVAMQFYGLQRGDRFVYLGLHDPAARAKEFDLSVHLRSESLQLGVLQPTRLRYGADYRQVYPFVLQTTTGDWYDGAQLYREWALTAPWTSAGPLSAGTKTPREFVETPLVLMRLGEESLDPAFVAKWAVRMREWFGVPITQHYYGWHQNFGSMSIDCYPEYFPTMPGFRQAVRKMEDADVRVMPYYNARLWRTDRESWRELGKAAAARDCYGRLFREVWMKIPTAVMNPASRTWRWVITQAVLRSVDAGCSAVYLDQLGEGTVHPSFDGRHPHEPGETASWIEAYRDIAGIIRTQGRSIQPDLVMTMEGNAEPFMHLIDSCLTGNSNNPDSIPLFSAVYHDYVMQFGRYVMSRDLGLPKAGILKFAQQYVFGSQFGWSNAHLERILPSDAPQALCLRAMARLRHVHAGLLAAGRMLRPLDLSAQVRTLDAEWYCWDKKTPVRIPEVLSSVWQRPDGLVGVSLVNVGDEASELTFDLPPAAYPVRPGGGSVLHRMDAGGAVVTETLTRGQGGWTISVPGLSPALLEVAGEPFTPPTPPPPPEATYVGYDLPTKAAYDALPFRVPDSPIGQKRSEDFPYRYEADALPAPEDPVWSLWGSAVSDGEHVVRAHGGALRLDSLSRPNAKAAMLTAFNGPAWDPDAMQGFTVETRLRVLATNEHERFALWVMANTPNTLFSLQVYTDRIVARSTNPWAVDMKTRMRTIRIVVLPGGERANLYLDEELLAGDVSVLQSVSPQTNLAVGPGASAGRVTAEIDYVRFDPTNPWLPQGR